ncbi:MAG TPA: protoporphyrinogen oxidase, partial [Gemmatimonadaceae bacterium]|nr:protoporphyrinogen oxidase [Gemmatimonadaceae bacterium]
GGMGELVESIERVVRSHPAMDSELRLATATCVTRVERTGLTGTGAYAVSLSSGERLIGDAVIVATPAHAAAVLLGSVDAQLASRLAEIEHASTVTVNVAFRQTDVPPLARLHGTGYVVPRLQRRRVLACTFSSNKFPARAPQDHALFRLYLGGIGRGDYTARADAELTAIVRDELREILGISAQPVLVRINRFDRALPQYELGHLQRLEAIDSRLAATPGLLLAGNAYRGVGIPDCVRSGQRAADEALAALFRAPGAEPRVPAMPPLPAAEIRKVS